MEFETLYRVLPLGFFLIWPQKKCSAVVVIISISMVKGAEISQIWNSYLNLEIVKPDKCQKYSRVIILLCPTRYCVQKFIVSSKIQKWTLAFNMDLFNFPLSTYCLSYHTSFCIAHYLFNLLTLFSLL